MPDAIKESKKAAREGLWELRGEHSKEDLLLARDSMIAILRSEDASPGEKIKAAQVLAKIHGANVGAPRPEGGSIAVANEGFDLSPEMQQLVDSIAGSRG